MRKLLKLTPPFLAAVFLLAASLHAADDIPTGPPDQAATRAEIDALIKHYTDNKSKATLGMLQRSMELSISFGAPAWNDGDHDACGKFYIATAEALCKAFPDQASASPAAWEALTDLKAALARAGKTDDLDEKAWALRYAFDKTSVAMSVQGARATAMLELGAQCIKRAELAESHDAIESVMAVTNELQGMKTDDLPQACIIAPTLFVDVLLAEKKYSPAAAMLATAIDVLPQVTQAARDMTTVYGDPAVYEKVMTDLKSEAKRLPNDASVQLLLGYEDFFSGLKASARRQFEKTLKIDKENAAAKAFLKQIAPTDGDEPLNPSHLNL